MHFVKIYLPNKERKCQNPPTSQLQNGPTLVFITYKEQILCNSIIIYINFILWYMIVAFPGRLHWHILPDLSMVCRKNFQIVGYRFF